MKKIYIGTSGYNYKHWKKVFYPEGLAEKKWLEFYSKHFNTVEINATFYGSFKIATFQNWAKQTPKDFIFSIKGPRFITHVKRLNVVEESVKRFFGSAFGLGDKLKVVLWQFPKNFKASEENINRLELFLKVLKKEIPKQVRDDKKTRNVFEFRDESWYSSTVYGTLNKYKVGIVINDSPRQKGGQAIWPKKEIITSDFAYIRLHGSSSLYSSNYSSKELKEWAKKIKKFRKRGDVYCCFNNDAFGYAVKNARELERLINSY